MKRTKAIVALGSNTRQEENIGKAKLMVASLLEDCRFTQELWTQPIGIDSDRFLNALATGYTTLAQEELQVRLKQIERKLGNTKEQRQEGVVCIDIDLLQYGTAKLKKGDWKRPYIQELVHSS